MAIWLTLLVLLSAVASAETSTTDVLVEAILVQLPSVCGDGRREGPEQCDDGNTAAGDGCNAECALEPGYSCEEDGACRTVCGDGARSPNEGCDDGNALDGDGCTSSCQPEHGFICLGSSPDVCSSSCGDALVASDEACDDGNQVVGDGCSPQCEVEEGFRCSESPQSEENLLTQSEENLQTQSEDNSVLVGEGRGRWEKIADVRLARVVAGQPQRFEHQLDSAEPAKQEELELHPHKKEVVKKAPAKKLVPTKGCVPVCGDGVLVGTEECDDGNQDGGDGCSVDCRVEPGYFCTSDDGNSECAARCGDQIRAGDEECDDGNLESGDGCSGECQVERGFECEGEGEEESACRTVCGDGVVTGSEACDDMNTAPDDGCSKDCQTVEEGWSCDRQPDGPLGATLDVCTERDPDKNPTQKPR
eukprot:TRINITY_DN26250_c0_g1_i1.p1 TRINITY_DN26250_c0_g1~~TRINITY_DN26250_c0_g1_i1.p1  ORF type:complete len:419 (-),score=93.14 TRINITY_DN26250_c0_g1_i1:306-1562(-)